MAPNYILVNRPPELASNAEQYLRGRMAVRVIAGIRQDLLEGEPNRKGRLVVVRSRNYLFSPLTLPQIEYIVELQLTDLRNRLSERQIHLEITPEARRLIAEHGFDPVYGARPLRRYIAHEVETKIGRALLRGEIKPDGTISVTVDGGELAVAYAEPAFAAA